MRQKGLAMSCQWKGTKRHVRHKVLMEPVLEEQLLMESSPDELILKKKAIFSQKLLNEQR